MIKHIAAVKYKLHTFSFVSGYLQPVRVENDAGMVQYYLDGGLVCNFPLHTFDGEYLLYLYNVILIYQVLSTGCIMSTLPARSYRII